MFNTEKLKSYGACCAIVFLLAGVAYSACFGAETQSVAVSGNGTAEIELQEPYGTTDVYAVSDRAATSAVAFIYYQSPSVPYWVMSAQNATSTNSTAGAQAPTTFTHFAKKWRATISGAVDGETTRVYFVGH